MDKVQHGVPKDGVQNGVQKDGVQDVGDALFARDGVFLFDEN